MPETDLYPKMMKAASKSGARLFRNHVGLAWQKTSDGSFSPFRIGLAPGSADLIGWTPVLITPEHVGKQLAVFTSIEAKLPPWHATPSWEKGPQGLWLRAVKAAGGIAAVATSEETCVAALKAS